MKRLIAALLLCLLPSLAQAASCTSYPFTLQNNTTADATQVMANFNTVRNCVVNNAAGLGVNTDITSLLGLTTPLAPASGGSSVFIGGTSTGSANAQVVSSLTPTGFALTSGYRVTFTAGFTNTGATTLNANSQGATAVNRVSDSGLQALAAGDIVAGNIVEAIYNGSVFVLLSPSPSTGIGTRTNIATGATVDLGTVGSHNAYITSSGAAITSFGSSASAAEPVFLITFAGANTLTYNATSLIIPGAGNITTAANDTAVVEYLGSGNWQVLSYTKASGAPILSILPIPSSFKNLAVKVATNTTVTATADFVTLYDGTNTITAPISCTIDFGSSGAVNKLDTGTIAAATWYSIWPVYNGVGTGCIGSLSATAPTMPAGYTFKARVGWVRTAAGSAQFMGTWQYGNQAQYVLSLAQTGTTYPVIADGTTASAMSAFSVSTIVPTTASKISMTLLATSNVGAFAAMNGVPAFGASGMLMGNASLPGLTTYFTGTGLLESTNVYYGSTGTSTLYAIGWDDNL